MVHLPFAIGPHNIIENSLAHRTIEPRSPTTPDSRRDCILWEILGFESAKDVFDLIVEECRRQPQIVSKGSYSGSGNIVIKYARIPQ